MFKRYFLFSLSLFVITTINAQAGSTFFCVDSNGTKSFQDKPCKEKTLKIKENNIQKNNTKQKTNNNICPDGIFKKTGENAHCKCKPGTVSLHAPGDNNLTCDKRENAIRVCPARIFKREGVWKNCLCDSEEGTIYAIEGSYSTCNKYFLTQKICPEGKFKRAGDNMQCRCLMGTKMRDAGDGTVYCAEKKM